MLRERSGTFHRAAQMFTCKGLRLLCLQVFQISKDSLTDTAKGIKGLPPTVATEALGPYATLTSRMV